MPLVNLFIQLIFANKTTIITW